MPTTNLLVIGSKQEQYHDKDIYEDPFGKSSKYLNNSKFNQHLNQCNQTGIK